MQEKKEIQPLPYYQPKFLKFTDDPKNPVISKFDPAPLLSQLDDFLKNYNFQGQQIKEDKTEQPKCLIKKSKLKVIEPQIPQNPKNIPFVDQNFPPNHQSQGPDQPKYQWKRASEFLKDPQVFVDDISPTDIRQGDLGDCYFLSALASLAEWPNTIVNLFQSRKQEKGGYYVIRICWKGVFQDIMIDDYFPVEHDLPVYSRCDGDEIWVLLIEKVWAKLHGNYSHIDGGLAREPLHDLTGAPSRTYKPKVGGSADHPTNHYIWQRIKDGELRDHAMCAGTILYPEGSKACKYLEKNLGLITGHIYTLIANYKLDLGKGHKEKIVKLRNPWGDHEWKGRLSDNDPIWKTVSEEIKKQIGYIESADDGIFFMEYEDFLNSFDDVTICYQYPSNDFAYEGVPFAISKVCKWVMYEVEISRPGIYFFQTCQRSIRTQPLTIQNDPKIGNNFYSSIIMTVGNQRGQSEDEYFQFRVHGNRREVLSWNYVEQPYEIPAGRYIVYIQIIESHYQQDDRTYGFGVYGSSKVKINQLDRLNQDLEQFQKLSLQQFDDNKLESIL